jgi:uncharacterized protein (DUF433 family)
MLKDSLIISASPEVMGGTPVFTGTRVPVQTLLDYLKAGESIDDFLDGFPTVTREQVIALLKEASFSKIKWDSYIARLNDSYNSSETEKKQVKTHQL